MAEARQNDPSQAVLLPIRDRQEGVVVGVGPTTVLKLAAIVTLDPPVRNVQGSVYVYDHTRGGSGGDRTLCGPHGGQNVTAFSAVRPQR